MSAEDKITLASPEHVAALPAIERVAAALLAGQLPASLAEETTPLVELEAAQAAGRLWVALAGDAPVGFAFVRLLPSGAPHLQEIDVHPHHSRRGLGTALLQAVQRWARTAGHPALTLTTFRHLAWNMPFYLRHGFQEVPPEELSAELERIAAAESELGLAQRVVLRYPATGDPPRLEP